MQRAGWLALIATPLSMTAIVAACATGGEKVPPAPNTLCAAAASWAAKCGTPASGCDADILDSCSALEGVMNTAALAAATSCLQNASTCNATPTNCLAGATSGITPTKAQTAVETDYCTNCQPSDEAACQQAFFTPASSVAQVSSSLLALDDTASADVDKCVVSGCGSSFPQCAQMSILNTLTNAVDGNNAAVMCIVTAIETATNGDAGAGNGDDMDATIGFGDDDAATSTTDGATSGNDGSTGTGGGDGGTCPVVTSTSGDGGSCVDNNEPNDTAATATNLGTLEDSAGTATATGSIAISGPATNCGDEDWYTFLGDDGFNDTTSADPYASITALTNVEVCVWANETKGYQIPSGCMSGVQTDFPAFSSIDGGNDASSFIGCCSQPGESVAQIQNYGRTADDDSGTVYMRVRIPGAGQMCVPYTLTYAFKN